MNAPTDTPAGLDAWIERLYEHPEMLAMGHNQSAEDRNLGLGWVYYALARLVQPARAVVIGSWRGFTPLVIGRALQDNRRPGTVTFIDPSFVDDFWRDPARTRAWFEGFGVRNVEHHLATTQEFAAGPAWQALGPVGLLFVDGHHTVAQARFDYEAFAPLLAPRALVLFHDSMVLRDSMIYGSERRYPVDVKHLMAELAQDPALQLLDLPFGTGLTVLRRRGGEEDVPLLEGRDGRPRA
jgi:predicted O-methyltransferase YrrM